MQYDMAFSFTSDKDPKVRAVQLMVHDHNIKESCRPMQGFTQEEWDYRMAFFIGYLIEYGYEDNELEAKTALGLPPDWKKGT